MIKLTFIKSKGKNKIFFKNTSELLVARKKRE